MRPQARSSHRVTRKATLTANGAYTHSEGATLRVHADASGAASRLNVNGAATLEGGTVDVQAEDGNYAPRPATRSSTQVQAWAACSAASLRTSRS